MKAIGRNDPCPCGSGKKFKRCHMGKENELHPAAELDDLSIDEMEARIRALPEVSYGKSRRMADALDLKALTGKDVRLKFVGLEGYAVLDLCGGGQESPSQPLGGGVFINPFKTARSDPAHLYLAISEDIDESTLVHQFAHVLAYLEGSGHRPETLDALSFELEVPVEHLDHPEEFGRWLEYLKDRFQVQLDADDTIISYLYQQGVLIKAKQIREMNGLVLKAGSDRIIRFLRERREVIDSLIKALPGYLGQRQNP
ncbi:MAG: SEC-C domain-containing protein [Thermodesulfobacteriota bacterium]